MMELLEDVLATPPPVDDHLLSLMNFTHILDMIMAMGQQDILEQ